MWLLLKSLGLIPSRLPDLKKSEGGTRRKLLASLMALSLLCGGLGVANAADGTVHVEDIAATTISKEVYTAGKVDTLLAEYGKKTDVDTNKDDIAALKTTTTVRGKKSRQTLPK